MEIKRNEILIEKLKKDQAEAEELIKESLDIVEIKKEQLEIEDELKFTQIAVIMVVIMNIILVSLFLCVAFG